MKVTNEVFEEIYSLYAKEIFNVAYGYLRNKDDAIDVVQNSFLKILKCKKDFKTLLDIKYFLIRIAINECIDILKSSYRKLVIFDNDIIVRSPQSAHDEDLYIVADLVADLPDKYKTIVILYYYDSMKVKDIAATLNLSESAVKKRLERARALMKEILERGDQVA